MTTTSRNFELNPEYTPRGDQPRAIQHLIEGYKHDKKQQTLLGVTGSGKTFSVTSIVTALQKLTLVIAPNKTLATQLTSNYSS